MLHPGGGRPEGRHIGLWCPRCCVTSHGSVFSKVASEVNASCEDRFPHRRTRFASLSSSVERVLALRSHVALDERDQEWQRVNSYIADVLKDTHVLYAKLARLQGDFAGPELTELDRISEKVLDLGEELSRFMKSFHEGDASMLKQNVFGGEPQAPLEQAPPKERTPEDYESEIRNEEEGEFSEFEEAPPEEGAGAGAGAGEEAA